jgi:hypothetical protein
VPSTIAVVNAFEAAMETALSIDVILGFPEVGRVALTYPLGAVVFDTDDYSVSRQGQQRPRIGQDQPSGSTLAVNLYLFASNEYNLFALLDSLRTVKAAAAGLVVSNTNIIVRYGQTQRTQVLDSDRIIENTMVTSVTFSWI